MNFFERAIAFLLASLLMAAMPLSAQDTKRDDAITDQITDQVEFRFADGSAPTIVCDAADESALYVLMPMRV